jgi:hypothetical protein
MDRRGFFQALAGILGASAVERILPATTATHATPTLVSSAPSIDFRREAQHELGRLHSIRLDRDQESVIMEFLGMPPERLLADMQSLHERDFSFSLSDDRMRFSGFPSAINVAFPVDTLVTYELRVAVTKFG